MDRMALTKEIKLYYFPSSYYSLKALLTLYEKDVQFEEQVVNIATGEQHQDWYLAINKNGEVPVLKIDGKYIAESETIIDIVDETFPSGSNLVPDLETRYGSDVREFRKLLHDIPVDIISQGILCNRHLKHKDGVIEVPDIFSRENADKMFTEDINKLRRKRENSPPEVQDAIDQKIDKISSRLSTVMNETKIIKCLDDLEPIFDKIEERLEKSQLDHKGSPNIWLFGPAFTAADITAATLFLRLKLIGLDTRYFSTTTRPLVYEYYTRLMKRPSVVKMKTKLGSLKGVVAKMKLKTYGIKALKVGLVVGLIGLGYFGFKEYFKNAKILQKT
ncbi:ganglioside-induced differentiation-associated protein 1-like [Mercenaria mercenaria]|uniref:ganglioside-induced differentiation-associated protein 1-like n=1 Tax=Mercenaria mercenaria TaxID=6596 RepID=UPI00234F092F|nr:ganglioside-induced differentiation-associated protein 1-like [Mercenaria mercenaria]